MALRQSEKGHKRKNRLIRRLRTENEILNARVKMLEAEFNVVSAEKALAKELATVRRIVEDAKPRYTSQVERLKRFFARTKRRFQ